VVAAAFVDLFDSFIVLDWQIDPDQARLEPDYAILDTFTNG
jgi:hypothetical protein